MVSCPNCGVENPDDATHCTVCKTDLSGLKLQSVEPSTIPELKERHLKRNLALLSVVILIVIAFAVALVLQVSPNIYSNSEWGFEVQVPRGWRKSTEEGKNWGSGPGWYVTFERTELAAMVSVKVAPLLPGENLDNYVFGMKTSWQVVAGATMVSENSRQIAGAEAWEVVWRFTTSYGAAKVKDVYVIHGGYGYAVGGLATYESDYDELDPIFENFIQSFRFI